MSHYTCLVIGEDVDGQLEPYDENSAVEPYKAYWDSDDYLRWEEILQKRTFTRKNKETGEDEEIEYPPEQILGEEYSLEEMRLVYMRRFRDYEDPPEGEAEHLADFGFEIDDSALDDKLHIDDGGIYEWSRYNPQSKWDWWVVGGRWRGFFKLRKHALAGAILGATSAISDNEPRYDSDQARKEEIDIEWMRDQAGSAAGERWDRVQGAIGHTQPALSWEHYLGRLKLAEQGEEGPYTITQAREDYFGQSRVKAFKEWNESLPDEEKFGWFGPNVEDFQVRRDVYVQRARDNALCPYAYVMDGEWHAPGKMGWFGASTDTNSERERFAREFNDLLDSLPDDTLLTLCDLHI